MKDGAFCHLLAVMRLSGQPLPVRLEATPAARRELAARFSLLALERLEADLAVRREGSTVIVQGSFAADVVQACVVSGQPVAAHCADHITLRFERPAPLAADLELDEGDLDCLPLTGDSIDVADVVAQSLGLALDPYPHADDSVLAELRRQLAPPDDREEPAPRPSPFAVLRRP